MKNRVPMIWVLILAMLPAMAGAELSREHSLALTEFRLFQVDQKSGDTVSAGVEALVPGDVISDLVRAGRLPHPFYGFNSRDALMVNEYDWLYRADFSADLASGERRWILFHGIDYVSRGSLNGAPLFEHTGMFSPVLVDATAAFRPGGPNILEVELQGLGNRRHSRDYQLDQFLAQLKRRTTLKSQMSYGWDIAVELSNAGIWDRVETFTTGPILISDLGITTQNDGRVALALTLDSNRSGPARLKVSVTPENFRDKAPVFAGEFPLEAAAGVSEYDFSLRVPGPELWWPNGLGGPGLYRLTAELVRGGKTSDRVSETFGFREIAWERDPDAPAGWRWVLVVNGRRVFMRGANWVPPSALAAEITAERYARLLALAADANINMLRVWGGGGREREIFYDLADRHGIMIWQEFPLACVYVPGYPTDRKFLGLVAQETGAMVRATRNHPSVVLYSGGNEFSPDQNKKVVDRMREMVSALAPATRFVPASPSPGDGHNWIVWHQQGNLTDYYDDPHAVMSEFGIQSLPARATLEKYFPADLLWPLGDLYRHHNMEYDKIMKYISAVPHPETLDGCIAASQEIQAYYFQRALEHWRIRKYRVTGTFLWMLDEPWPAVVGSVIDYELTPKAALAQIKRSYAPLLIAADLDVRAWRPGDDFQTDVFLVNDTSHEFSHLTARALICGEPAGEWTLASAPDSSLKVASLTVKLPDHADPVLELSVSEGATVISQNRYDLGLCDGQPAGRLGRGLERLSKKILSGFESP